MRYPRPTLSGLVVDRVVKPHQIAATPLRRPSGTPADADTIDLTALLGTR